MNHCEDELRSRVVVDGKLKAGGKFEAIMPNSSGFGGRLAVWRGKGREVGHEDHVMNVDFDEVLMRGKSISLGNDFTKLILYSGADLHQSESIDKKTDAITVLGKHRMLVNDCQFKLHPTEEIRSS